MHIKSAGTHKIRPRGGSFSLLYTLENRVSTAVWKYTSIIRPPSEDTLLQGPTGML